MILGEATIRMNGTEMKSVGKAKANVGGYERKQHNGGGKSWGNSEKYSPPYVEMGVVVDEEIDVFDLNETRDATITFEGNNGRSYMFTGCSLEKSVDIDEDSGEVTGMKWLAKKCKPM